MTDITCTHCGQSIVMNKKLVAAAGSTILCPHCDTPATLLRRKQPSSQKPSEALQIYLSYCQESCTNRNAPFNAARIRRFETYLAEHDLTLQSVEKSHIKDFLQWIENTQNAECSRGYATNLREFFHALTQNGFLSANPLGKQGRQIPAITPIDTTALSEELKAFVEYQQTTVFSDSLQFDLNRILTWEAFLAQRGKRIRTAEEADFITFMADVDQRLTSKQSCGLVLTLQDLYGTLVQLGMLEKSPEPADFAHRQELMELILHAEETSQTLDRNLRQLRHTVRTTRNWRVIFLVTAGIVLSFSGLLAYQLLSKNISETQVLGKIQQKAHSLKNVMLSKQPTTQPVANNVQQSSTSSLSQPVKEITPVIAVQPSITTSSTSSSTTTTVSTTTTTTTTIPETTTPQNTLAPQDASQKTEPPANASSRVEPPGKGCIAGDCVNGMGTFLYSDGAQYMGNWHNGKMHGEGKFQFSSGRGYRGKWKNGRLTTIY